MTLTLNGKKVLDRTLLHAQEFVLDADGDSSLTADTDDQLDLRLGGNDVFVFKTSELDISGVNIVNCGDIALDSISDDDGTGINIAMMDASATALTIKEAANAYLTFDTSNGTENIILGKKLTGGAVEIEGSAFDINGGTVDGITSLTVGTDGSGADVYFYSATGGDHLFWDSSEELLTITGTNGQTALNVADGNVIVVDTFYLFDAGGESLSSDGTDFTIASGALINLTATSDVVIPVSVGLHLGDGAEKLESNNTDLTINSGVDINLTATTDINVPASVGMTFGDDGEKIEGDGTDLTIASSGVLNLNATSGIAINGQDITNGGVIFLTEQAAAEADVEGKGQIWVKTATPNELWFTDDAGADVQLGLAGGAHAILDGSVHSDSVADAVTRGSLIYGNSTPKWDELVLGGANTFVGSDGTDISYRSAAQVLASLSGAAGAAFAWNSQNLTGIGTLGMTGGLTITPGAAGTFLDFGLETEWVSGTLIRADFGGATTLNDDTVVVGLDFSSNVSLTTDKDLTGYQIKLPAFTQGAANTTTIMGFDLPTAGALVQDTAAGTLTWKGINIQMPNITQTTGTVTSTGITITGGTVTSGTSYGLIIDANAGNVGIGETTPLDMLHITSGNIRLSDNHQIRWEGADNWIGGNDASDFLNFATNGTEKVRIDSTGKVGIGTAISQSLLDVQGAAGAAGVLTLATKELTVVDGDVLGRINFNAPLESDGGDAILVGAAIWAEADATFSSTVNSTELVFATGTSEAAVERMRIDSSGNVGIGTTGPATQLQLYQSPIASSTDWEKRSLTVGIGINTANRVYTGYDMMDGATYRAAAIGYGYDGTGYFMSLGINDDTAGNPIEGVRIGRNGDVGIGTTSPGQILDCNAGSGNMIADGYDNHPSFLADKVDPVPMSDVLTKFKQVIPYEYKRIPHVSAEELAAAGIKEFGQERWEAAFPDGYRGGKLKDCPDEEIKAFLDNLADELRTERQEWPEYQRLHYSLALDDLAYTFPDILSRNKDGDVTGYSLNNYVGLLHACITELVEKVEQLEIGKTI